MAALFLAVCAISTAAIFFKLARPTHPLVAAATRLSIAALLLFPPTLWQWRQGAWRRTVAPWAVLGGVLYAVHFGAWVASLWLTSVASSVTLVCITPLFLVGWAWITGRDKPRVGVLGAMAMASVGVVLIGAHDVATGQSAWVGDLFAMLGALAIAPYLLVVRRLGPELKLWPFMGTACGVGALLLWAAAAGIGVSPLRPVSWEAFVALACAALLPQLVGHSLLAWSLRHISPVAVSVGVLAEPVIASVLGLVILGESLPPLVLLGGAVTLLAVGVALWLESQGGQAEAEEGG